MRGGLENAFDPDDFKQQETKRSKKKQETLEDRVREAGL